MKGAAQVASVLRKRPDLRSAGEVALVHTALQPLAFYQRLHPDPAACGPAQAHLCRAALLQELDQDDVLHEEGALGVGFCLILSGGLSEYKRQYAVQSGAGRYLHKLGPGRGFGEEALTQGHARVHSSTLVAAEATELLVLRRDDYAAMTAMAQQALHVSEDDLLRLFALTSTLLFFRPVPAPSLLQLARALETAAAAAGQVVVAHGQPGAAMYVILAGSVAPQARRRESRGGGAEGSEGASEAGGQTGAALQAGDAFGEEALLHGDGLHVATMVAVEATQFVLIPRAAFDRALRGLASRLHYQPGQLRRTLAHAPRRRSSAAVQTLATQMQRLPFFAAFSPDCLRHLATGCTLAHAYAGDCGPSRAPSSSSSGACSIYVHDEDPASATMPTPRTTSDPSPTSPTRPSHVSFPGKPSGVPSQGALLGDNTRRGTRTTGGRDDDVPDMHAGTQAGPPPSVPLVVQLVGTAERGSRRGGGRFATSSGVSLPSPRSSSPSRRSRFATEASTLPVLPPEPFVSFGAPVSPRGSPKRRLLESLERSEPSSCPVSPRASLLPPALDDPPSLSRCKPRRSTLAAPFVPPPWPEEVPSHGAAPARPRSPAVKVSRTTSGTGGTSPSRPPSSGGKGAQRGLSDEDFEKLVSSFRGGAKVAPEASKAALEKVPPPTLRSRGREQKGGSGQHEHAAGVKGDAVGAPSCPCARPWKGFLLSGGDADVDAGNDAKSERRWGRLVRTCGEGDAFGELELLGGKPQPRAATVVATEATELLVIAPDDYRRHLQSAHARQLAAHCDFLSCVPLFRGLSAAALRGLVYRLRPREVTAKGAPVLEQGRPADGLYIVHGGDVILSAAACEQASSPPSSPMAAGRAAGSARVDLAVLGPGAVFGETCLTGAPLEYAVAAASARVELLVLHPADVRALGSGVVAAVTALAEAKSAFRAAHSGLALAAGQRQSGDAGRQLPAWLQKLPSHLHATQNGAPLDNLSSPRVGPLVDGPPATGAQTPRRVLRLEIPLPSEPQLRSAPSPSPRGSEAGSPFEGRPKLAFSLSWPRGSPPGSPNRAAAPSPVDTSLKAHMAQVMGASWGLR